MAPATLKMKGWVVLVMVAMAATVVVEAATGKLVIYWGQNVEEGSLADACNTGIYDVVVLAFIAVFGNGQQPVLNLAGHCDPESNACVNLTSDIQTSCQSMGISVLVSLGGGSGSYGLASDADAKGVAQYLWDNYLGGSSDSRPLGPAVLDGVDFDIEASQNPYWPSLASYLKQFSGDVLLSTAPQCPFPDAYMGPGDGTALGTGLFDFVWVQFYNNPPCDYGGSGTDALLAAWDQWTAASSIPGSAAIFLGLPATADAAPSGGYLPADVLKSQVLPQIKKSPSYAGVMLWSRYYDNLSGYGASIRDSL